MELNRDISHIGLFFFFIRYAQIELHSVIGQLVEPKELSVRKCLILPIFRKEDVSAGVLPLYP